MYSLSSDQRALALVRWLKDGLGLDIRSIAPASSDASFRRYFRVHHAGGCHIVMDAPPDRETTEPFVRIAKLLQAAGLHVPEVYHCNREQGFLLLEDLGATSYLERLNADSADLLYASALDSLLMLQTGLDPEQCALPRYDHALLQRELNIFHEWFLEKLLGLVMPRAIKQAVDEMLIDAALSQPQVCVHRDFHSRNLMVLEQDATGVIDFQDAVIGPISYDVVSLLRDCYIRWPQDRVVAWAQAYYRRLVDVDRLDVEFEQFLRWFDWMGLQRHLKAVGIFARLHLRDNKSNYLADIPRTMSYITEVCAAYPELAEFDAFLQRQVLPVYRSKL